MSVVVKASREILQYSRKGYAVKALVYGAGARRDLVEHYEPISKPAAGIVSLTEDKISLPFTVNPFDESKVQTWFDPSRPIDYAIEADRPIQRITGRS